MGIDRTIVTDGSDLAPEHQEAGAFEYRKRLVVPRAGNQATVAFMEIPPGRSGYPYHWHEGVTEVYVILAGSGTLRTPEGDRRVEAGDVVVLPPGLAGAHRLTNDGTEVLRYVDVDTTSDPDVTHYPDSGKAGLILGGVAVAFHRDGDAVPYYDGEPDAG
ncbi:cupin domain-containing protein [Demequina subtropica]|uniref:cupin domain-containing protein n=1 Tax=Demequina subtropica TaxID=1638989 RepID=UPI000784C13A|nr:cupin domain-containing protein [Demequina subtropica]